jgi:hypothetical protein
MFALVGRVRLKLGREDEALAVIGEFVSVDVCEVSVMPSDSDE